MMFLIISCILISSNLLLVSGYITGPCEYDEDCQIEHAYCQMQMVCRCKNQYIPTPNNYDCVPMVGTNCYTLHDCSKLPNSGCSSYTCNCNKGFVPDSNSTQCLPIVKNVGSNCTHHTQCSYLLGESKCLTNKTCQCKEGSHYDSGACFKSSGINEPCRNKSNCYINERNRGRIDCINSRCQCAHHFIQSNNECKSTGSIIKDSWNFIIPLLFYFISTLFVFEQQYSKVYYI